MMELKYYAVTIVLLLVQLVLSPIKAENERHAVRENTFYETLFKRMDDLEVREKTREIENADLRQRLLTLENIVKGQQSQIHILKETVKKQDDTNKQLHERIQYLETREKADNSLRSEINAQKKRIQFIECFFGSHGDKLPAGKMNDDDKKEFAKKVVERRQKIKKRDNEVNVAFFAYLNNHITNPGVHQIIAFDHVTTNIGNGYNLHAGDFRAPVAGTYVFATTLMAGDSSINYHFKIMHNAKLVSNLYITNGGTTSQEVVLQLNQGDDVSIHNMDAGQKVYGDGYSTFSGFLLQQNYSSPAIVGR